ncbi:hypothetical protein PSI23_22150, partial [Xenorhabdus sp. XENO-10]
MVIMSGDSLMLRSPQSQNHISLRGVVRNQSSFLNRVNIGNSVQSAEILADGYTNIFGHLSNSLISNQTPDLAFGHTLAVP